MTKQQGLIEMEGESADRVAAILFVVAYAIIDVEKSTGMLPSRELARRPGRTAPAFARIFQKAGFDEIPLTSVAEIHAQVDSWLKDGTFDAGRMTRATAAAKTAFETIRPTVEHAVEHHLVLPDPDGAPLPFAALGQAAGIGQLMLAWNAAGRLQDEKWRARLAAGAKRGREFFAKLVIPAVTQESCRAFPAHRVAP